MANPYDDNDFGLGDVRSPLARAVQVERRHESHTITGKVWSIAYGAGYAAAVTNPLTGPIIIAFDPRIKRVLRAVSQSLDGASRMMGSESLKIGQGLIAGIVPMLGDMAKYVGIGAVIGGAVGAVGGLGVLDEATIPGGAMAGAELGLWIGGFIGLADILVQGAQHLGRFVTFAVDATEIAWYAGDDRAVSMDSDINAAAKLFSFAIAELWWVILQALIAWVMKKAFEIGGKAGAAAIDSPAFKEALVEAKGKTAKFGSAFGEWFEKNFRSIKETVEQRERELKQIEEEDRGEPDATPETKPYTPRKLELKEDNTFKDPSLEERYQKYLARKRREGKSPKTRERWLKANENADKGVYGEARSDAWMNDQGFDKLNGDLVQDGDAPKGRGIDGVWKNRDPNGNPQYVITETKYGSSDLGTTADGPQLSDDWVEQRLNDEVGKSTANDIRDAQESGTVQKWLLNVDQSGTVTKSIVP